MSTSGVVMKAAKFAALGAVISLILSSGTSFAQTQNDVGGDTTSEAPISAEVQSEGNALDVSHDYPSDPRRRGNGIRSSGANEDASAANDSDVGGVTNSDSLEQIWEKALAVNGRSDLESAPSVTEGAAKLDATEPVRAGDVLKLYLPGEASLSKEFPIDRFGRIELPEVGLVEVQGLVLRDIEQKLHRELAPYFRDIEELRVDIFERRLLVKVSGQVANPGIYDLARDASVENAITAAGGMKMGAQLDRLLILRGRERIKVNFRQFLDTGNKALLPELNSLDELFVPISGLAKSVEVEFDAALLHQGDANEESEATVSVFGEVHRPGRFTFKDDQSLLDYLLRSGGPTMYAGVETIRVLSDGEPVRFDLTTYLDSGDKAHLPQVSAGTTIFVPRAKEAVKRSPTTVYVMGEVNSPGSYEAGNELTFMDLLANAGGPTRYAETRQIRLIKADGAIEKFDLVAFTEGLSDAPLPVLGPSDAIFVPEKADQVTPSWLKTPPEKAIYLIGAVERPGRYEWSPEMSLLDLLSHGGGPTPKADVANITVVPGGADVGKTPNIFNLDMYQKAPADQPLPDLAAQYMVMIPQLPDDPNDNKAQWVRQSPEDSLYVMGAVNTPGRYGFNDSQGFLDILSAADGPAANADLENVQIIHRSASPQTTESFNLSAYLETGNDALLPAISTGDVLFIPTKSGIFREINIIGAVAKPGQYEWSESLSLLELLAISGGPNPKADLAHIQIIADAEGDGEDRVSQFNLDLYMKGQGGALPTLARGFTVMVPELPEDPADNKAQWVRQAAESSIYVIGAVNSPGRYAFNETMGFLDILSAVDGPLNSADLRNIQITHRDRQLDRVETFSLVDYLQSGDDSDLPTVKTGDVIFVPQEDGPFRGVNILGAVNKPGRYEWARNMTIIELLAQASGPNERADLSAVVVSPGPERTDQMPSKLFDLEEYLRTGEGDVPLLNKGDTILIAELPNDPTDNKSQWVRQPASSSIYIMGEVNAPGRYMFTDQLGFLDILGAADGPTAQADLARIFIIHRSKPGDEVSVFDFRSYVESGREGRLPEVSPEDVIFLVRREGPERHIGIVGEVRRPGQFEWRPGMTLVELIEQAGGPTDQGDIANIRITPGGVDQGHKSRRFDLQEYYDLGDLGRQPVLKAGYSIYVPALPDDDGANGDKATWLKIASEDAVYVFGEVGNPGRYAFNDSMNVLDILAAANGPTSRADIHNIRVGSRNKNAASVEGLNLSLYMETGDEHLLPRVLPGDVIYVPSRDRIWLDNSKETTVRVLGAVRDPGRYTFDDTMTILDLIAEAGGPTGQADVHKISVINLSCCEDRARSFDLAYFATTGDFGSLPLLRLGDTIYVPFQEEAPIDTFTRRASSIIPMLTLLLVLL